MAVTSALPGMRRTRAAGWARRLGAFSLMLLVVSVLAHRQQMLATPGFIKVMALETGLALVALLCAAVAFGRLWDRGDPVGGDVAIGAVAATAALLPALSAAVLAAMLPRLVDVSTDTQTPPAFAIGQDARGIGANPLTPITPQQARQQEAAYPALAGHRYEFAFDDGVAMVEEAIARSGWVMIAKRGEPGEMTLAAVARSPVFAMPADVSVRIIDEDGTVFIDLRSAWRYGWHDFGDNAARIEAFYVALDALARTWTPSASGVE